MSFFAKQSPLKMNIFDSGNSISVCKKTWLTTKLYLVLNASLSVLLLLSLMPSPGSSCIENHSENHIENHSKGHSSVLHLGRGRSRRLRPEVRLTPEFRGHGAGGRRHTISFVAPSSRSWLKHSVRTKSGRNFYKAVHSHSQPSHCPEITPQEAEHVHNVISLNARCWLNPGKWSDKAIYVAKRTNMKVSQREGVKK